MDGIIQSFYRHSERGQSVRTDKSKSFTIFHSSARHTYEANLMLHFPRETAPPRPMVITKVLGQTLTSGEGVWEDLGRRLGRSGREVEGSAKKVGKVCMEVGKEAGKVWMEEMDGERRNRKCYGVSSPPTTQG